MAFRALLKGSTILMVGMNVANFGSYVFNVLAARLLGPAGYGEVVAMITVLTLLTVPINVLVTVVTRFVSADVADKNWGAVRGLLAWFERRLYPLGLGVTLIFIAASWGIARFLNLHSVWTVLALTGGVFASFGLPVVRGGLQGVQRFWALAGSFLADTAGRLGAGLGLIAAGLGSAGAVAGLSVGALASFLVGKIFLFRGLPPATPKRHSGKDMGRFALPTLIGWGAITFLTFSDVLFVKHTMSPELAGQYGALSTIAHIAFYIALPIMGALMPIAATTERSGKNPTPVLLGGLGLTIAASGAVAAGFALFPEFVIRILYGPEFIFAAPYLGMYALAMLFITVATMETMYLLSVNRLRFVWMLAGIALVQLVLFAAWAQTPAQFITVLTLTAAGTMLALLPFALMRSKTQR